MELTTSIIPSKPTYAKTQGPRELNLEAICIYSAIGFFLDTDTFTKNKIALPSNIVIYFDCVNRRNISILSKSLTMCKYCWGSFERD